MTNVVYFYTGGDQPTDPTDPTDPPTDPTDPPTEPPTEPISDNPEGVLVGAVLNGETITINDVTAIQEYLAERRTFNEDQMKAADCNGDKRISIKDATVLQKYLAEYTTEIGNVGRRV